MTADNYSVYGYGAMLRDPVRMSAYREAMARAIKPGDIVCDIGTGPGVTALIACQLGASHVYAIDPNPSILLGERLARQNGFSNKITFIKGLSSDFVPDRPVDVLLSDLRGRLPMHGMHIPSIIDARSRLLRPGGIQLPARDKLFVGLARDEAERSRLTRPWRRNDLGLDLSMGFQYVVNALIPSNSRTTASLGEGKCWCEIDYTSTLSADVSGSATLAVPERDVVDFLELWFEAEVLPGIHYSTSPSHGEQVYGRMLLPLLEPIALESNELVDVRIDARLVKGDYLYTWRVSIRHAATGFVRLRTVQSTFLALLIPASGALFEKC